MVELLLRMLACEGATEDIRQQPHPIQKIFRPAALRAHATEAQRAMQFARHDDRHRHVRFEADAAQGFLVDGCVGRKVVETLEHDRPVGHHHVERPGSEFARRHIRHRGPDAFRRERMGDLHPPAQGKDPTEGGSIDAERRDDARQTVVDGTVDFPGAQGDESSRQIRQEPFEAKEVVHGDRRRPLHPGRGRCPQDGGWSHSHGRRP